MIQGKNGVTAVVLAMASAQVVMTFVQHKNGGLSQGDDSSATPILEDIKASVLKGMARNEHILKPIVEIEALLKQYPILEKTLPADLRNRLGNSKDKANHLKNLQANMAADLADVEKLLDFARLYDKGDEAKVPEGIDPSDLDATIDDLVNKLFPKQSTGEDSAHAQPRNGDMMFGCGEPGCEGCGGRKMFEFDENESHGGKPLFSLGSLEVPADFAHFSDNLPEELKKIFGDKVHVVKVGGQRGTDPLQGLAEALAKALGK